MCIYHSNKEVHKAAHTSSPFSQGECRFKENAVDSSFVFEQKWTISFPVSCPVVNACNLSGARPSK